jgi:hypothetical protein
MIGELRRLIGECGELIAILTVSVRKLREPHER